MSQAAEMDEPLHVLTLTPFFPSDKNEVNGCFIAEPIEQLKQFGIESSVIAVSPIYRPRKHATSSSPAEWVRYPQVPGNLGLSSAGKLLFVRLLRHIRKLHDARPIDVIHAHAALPCGHAALLLSRRLQIPFVVTVHGLDVFHTCYLGGIPALWRRQASLDVYRAARTVICISGRVRDKVREILQTATPPETPSAIVYNGVNPILFSPNPPTIEPIDPEILIVGNLLPSKGQELVLRALASLRPSFPQLRCRLIGEGPDRTHLEALAHDLHIGNQVHFAGRRSRSEVAEAMRRCSVFVLPSRNEGLGCVYLEAMSCAKPAIACRGQGIEDVIEHGRNGWLIPADGLEALAQGISALIGSPDLRARMGTAARQTILEKLTLSHQAQRLASIYRQAVA
ncbi:MAG: glycosyltransferase [Terriglobales bacterium]|jgi:glycosyltransferase involved in cell wall biosynthesis